MNFPKGFLWGSATASFQVEGGIENNDWAEAGRESRVPICGKATDHYNKFEADFDIAKSLGHNTHRFSIEWSRIEPEEGQFDEKEIEHYRNVLRALKERRLEPFVTLWHFTLPTWFSKKGGFLNPKAPEIFSRYCEFVVERLGGEAKYWMTINEPLIWASGGYLKGKWPPFNKSAVSFLKVFNSLVRAHRLAFEKIKKANSGLQVGIAKHNIYFSSDFLPWNILIASFSRWFWNHRFLKKISKHQDFIGLNYYIHKRFGRGEEFEKTEMGWDIYPEGFFKVLLELKRYEKDVYITENGLADSKDRYRAEYITKYLGSLEKAIQSGVRAKGYFYWSLLDNYEWSFGFEKRFGLVEINYETLERKIRPSALVYKKIIEENIV